jgi:hypothetical protein
VRLFWTPLLATSLALSAGSGAEPNAVGRIRVGEPFPDLFLPALEDGRPRSIQEFRGRKLALHVFASW